MHIGVINKVKHTKSNKISHKIYGLLGKQKLFLYFLQMQDVQQSKEKTLANNRTLAEQNLDLQPELEHKKEQLTKRYTCLQESFESYQLRKSSFGTATEPTGLYFFCDYRIFQTISHTFFCFGWLWDLY